ncbi:MAG: hydroxyethylthiazole kinase [Sarcina sp.]
MFNLINKVKETNPLVLHYTNEVTINDCANMTLAIGASPLMSYSMEEIDEIIKIASAVVINIGTMNSDRLELFVEAAKTANKYGKPVILDPVGVFATKVRANFVKRLLNEAKFTVIKGNIAEIKYIAGLKADGQGVDSNDDGVDLKEQLKEIAKNLNSTIVATGKYDFISDGEEVIVVENGTIKLKSVTGTGCMTASLIGAYLAVSEKSLEAAAMGALTMSLAGELADKDNPLVGTFKVNLFNEVYDLNEEKIRSLGRIN